MHFAPLGVSCTVAVLQVLQTARVQGLELPQASIVNIRLTGSPGRQWWVDRPSVCAIEVFVRYQGTKSGDQASMVCWWVPCSLLRQGVPFRAFTIRQPSL